MSYKRFLKNHDLAPPLNQPERVIYRDLGGSQAGTTTSTSTGTASPWEAAQPFLKNLFNRAEFNYNSNPGYLAQQSPYTLQAIQQQATQAQDPNSLVGQAQRQLGKTIAGDYLTIDGNPAAQAAMNAARRTVNSQFRGDNYGSSANQEWLARGAAEAVSPILMQERQNQLNALNLAPSLQMAPTQQLAAAGAAQDSRKQGELDAPWDILSRYRAAISGQPGGSSSQSSQNPYFTNPTASLLGAGIGGLSLYNGLNQSGLLSGMNGLFGGADAAITGAGLTNFAGDFGSLGGNDLLSFMFSGGT